MKNELKTTVIQVRETARGKLCIDLPAWVVIGLYKMSGIRSRKLRQVNKAIKNTFLNMLKASFKK